MTEMMRDLFSWLDTSGVPRNQDFHRYAQSIANARYVIRRVFRIVDEQARAMDLDPLEHQALLQIYGFDGDSPSVSGIAERLDIAAAFASRLIKGLETRGLVNRVPLATDRRVTVAEITKEGVALLRQVDEAVHLHVKYFQSQLSDHERMDSLMIFAFYVGLESDSVVADAIRDELQTGSRSHGAKQPNRTKP
jgi:DNA-binding MarR family transcriptional regulator